MSAPSYQPLPIVSQPASVKQVSARYTVDHETVGRMKGDFWEVATDLIRLANDPRWSRERACWGCNNWKAVDGLAHLPFRPGAGSAAVESCTNCHYAKLDAVGIDPDMAEQTLDAMNALRDIWRGVQGIKKTKAKRYTRVLAYDSVASQQGYTGKRSERPPEVSSFRSPPNDPTERIDCPWCHEKNGARVERYTRIKPHKPGEEKQPDVRFIAIHCLLTPCGKRIVQPEAEPMPFTTYRKGEEPIK